MQKTWSWHYHKIQGCPVPLTHKGNRKNGNKKSFLLKFEFQTWHLQPRRWREKIRKPGKLAITLTPLNSREEAAASPATSLEMRGESRRRRSPPPLDRLSLEKSAETDSYLADKEVQNICLKNRYAQRIETLWRKRVQQGDAETMKETVISELDL